MNTGEGQAVDMNQTIAQCLRYWRSMPISAKAIAAINFLFICYGIFSVIPDPAVDWSWILNPSLPEYFGGLLEVLIAFLPIPILLLLIGCKKLVLTRFGHAFIIVGLSILPTVVVATMLLWPFAILAINRLLVSA